MRIATWNVNSVRARLDRLVAWLAKRSPDVLCLQELKCTAEQFPFAELREAGYHAVVSGQKTYNGVAILSREEPDEADVVSGLPPGPGGFEEARLVRARFGGLTVYSAYVPQGDAVDSDKYAYKLRWLAGLRDLLDTEHSADEPVVLCGDLNVIRDDLDAENPAVWEGTVIATPEVRQGLSALLDWGLVDTHRRQHPDGKVYSFWDYRFGAFQRNHGLRLDYVLATEPAAAATTAAEIDRDERKKGTFGKPSDHAPVIVEFAL